MTKPVFSLVIPTYNEEEHLERAVKAAMQSLRGTDYEIIIAEDGSTDSTPEIARSLAKKFPRVRCLHFDGKLGKGAALCNAFGQARGEFFGYMDADLATHPKHLKQLVKQLGKNDVVLGSRYVEGSRSKRTTPRLFLSSGFNALVQFLLGSRLRDHQCGFKGFRRQVALNLCALATEKHWFWDTEMLVLAQRRGLRVKELPVEWNEDAKGRTKINFKRDVLEMGAAAVKMCLKGFLHKPRF